MRYRTHGRIYILWAAPKNLNTYHGSVQNTSHPYGVLNTDDATDRGCDALLMDLLKIASIPLVLSARIRVRVFKTKMSLASFDGSSRSNVCSDATIDKHCKLKIKI